MTWDTSTLTESELALLYARAAAHFMGTGHHPFCASVVVARTGLGPRTLARRIVAACEATAHAIARGRT